MSKELLIPSSNILLIEDDADTASYITDFFLTSSLQITVETDGIRGLDLAISRSWDCIILDRRLPGIDGLTVLTRLRAMNIQTPVLFLTTMDGIRDRVVGLRSGGDDYLVKPFAVAELSARIEGLLRRTKEPSGQTYLTFADVKIDLLTREVTRAGEKIYIQAQELKLLEYFMNHPCVVLSREMILQAVWDIDFPIRTNLVETHVSRLRERLGRDAPPLIHTVKGQGYTLRNQ
ncbi:response regulator transcription factor [Acetobacter sp.]|jgi:two-component system OmpR family response regulator|uniref:response regulator transcription factor n=1 Tax=Acetobacter sp. TaxID=440 RepID=UPI0025C1FE45|nr:response regulator transcription factor [Acetobacter sp.]MCH4089777.1 response regulator transcription factor [Acetobacter sp.]MCI1298473.1 response regulator transcription factor [Acetobacter sp.]MCI1316429.1 response regulator transcription factor [Acetobacter sp.]